MRSQKEEVLGRHLLGTGGVGEGGEETEKRHKSVWQVRRSLSLFDPVFPFLGLVFKMPETTP